MDKLALSKVEISELMTKNLITIPLGSTVEEAVNKMVNSNVECLPVVDSEGTLYGLLTFRDVVMKVVYPSVVKRELKVEDIMSKNLITCNPTSSVLDVIKILKNKHLRRIPVIDDKNVLVGLVTDFDLSLFGWNLE